MKAQHTAGPWELAGYNTTGNADNDFAGDNDVTDSMGRLIAEVTEWGTFPTSANAALISASPDLLQCLEDVMQDLFGRLNHGVSMEHMEAAAAAIAKAKGGM